MTWGEEKEGEEEEEERKGRDEGEGKGNTGGMGNVRVEGDSRLYLKLSARL